MIHLCREAFSGVEIYVERYAALSYNGGGFKDPGFEARVCESQFRAVVRITERGGRAGPSRCSIYRRRRVKNLCRCEYSVRSRRPHFSFTALGIYGAHFRRPASGRRRMKEHNPRLSRSDGGKDEVG